MTDTTPDETGRERQRGLPVFEGGDILEVGGGVYEVDSIDWVHGRDEPLQYRLEAVEGPPARLKPAYPEGAFTFIDYHKMKESDIVVRSVDTETDQDGDGA